MDPLSVALDGLQLRSFVASRNEFTAPWGLRIPGSIAEVPERFRPPLHIQKLEEERQGQWASGGFYVITQGRCWMEIDGRDTPLCLNSGDMVVLMPHVGHRLRDALNSEVRGIWEFNPIEKMRKGLTFRHGGGGELTTLVVGRIFFENQAGTRLLTALPPVIHVRAEENPAVPHLQDTLRFMSFETASLKPGGISVINHLSHVLFIQAVRAYVSRLPTGNGNWLAALLDPEIGPTLSEIHLKPQAPWTVASLADTAAMSRSAFAARFTEVIGRSPWQYVTECRMNKAMILLRNPNLAIKQIAAEVGYESEAAFSNAFKRVQGKAPGAFRRHAASLLPPVLAAIREETGYPREPASPELGMPVLTPPR